jgi:glucuronokinase
MDFAPERRVTRSGYQVGAYERLDLAALPPLYLAYKQGGGKAVQAIHSTLRVRYERGDPDVLAAMRTFAGLTDQARAALAERDNQRLHRLIDENFDARRRITDVRQDYLQMVERARAAGASANFSGSGGAIIGTYGDEATFAGLEKALEGINCRVLKVVPVPPWGRAGT